MVFKFFSNLKKLKAGITLIEIVVTIFIIALFSMILIVNFPEIQRRLALSRATYQLAQDMRKTLDLSLSGVPLEDFNSDPIGVKGYGIYINLSNSDEQYVIYADVADKDGLNDQKYSGEFPYVLCDNIDQDHDINSGYSDCIVETIDVNAENPSIYIKDFANVSVDNTSINFNPPNPVINITNRQSGPQIDIVLGIRDEDAQRTVSINTSGAINVQ